LSDHQTAIKLACDGIYGAKSLYSEWTFSEPDDRAREMFAHLADRKQRHLERLGEYVATGYRASSGGAVHDHLCSCTETAERIGAGVLARTLLERSTYECFLSNLELDAPTRDVFLEIKSDTETTLTDATDIVADYSDPKQATVRESCDETLQIGLEALRGSSGTGE
ncbi:MAG: hypothetical protein ABEI52_06195, partial [Halobacteriaceae archaeon]